MKLRKSDVQKTLDRMNRILSSPDFDIEKNLQLIINSKGADEMQRYKLSAYHFTMQNVLCIGRMQNKADGRS